MRVERENPLDRDVLQGLIDQLNSIEIDLEEWSESPEIQRILEGIANGTVPVMMLFVYDTDRELKGITFIADPAEGKVKFIDPNNGNQIGHMMSSYERCSYQASAVQSTLRYLPRSWNKRTELTPGVLVVCRNMKREGGDERIVTGFLYGKRAEMVQPGILNEIAAIQSGA